MKQKIFKNKILIISIIILLSFFMYTLVQNLKNYYYEHDYVKKRYDNCIREKGNSNECKEIKEWKDNYKLSPTQLLYTELVYLTNDEMSYLTITFVLFVSIPAIQGFYKSVKSKIFRYELQRMKYKEYFIKYYKESLKSTFILPIYFIISFLIVCFVTGFNFDLSYLSPDNIRISGNYATERWVSYYLIMLFALITHSVFYINLAYISFYKVRNFAINILYTYILYILSQIMIVPFIQFILIKILKSNNNSLIISFEDPLIMRFGGEVPEFKYMILSSIIYVLLSSFILYLIYRKKERFVITNEN